MKRITIILITVFATQLSFGQNFADLVAKVDSSVVTIYTESKVTVGNGDPFKKTDAGGLGSGVLIGKDHKIILTAAHVVSNSNKITVEFIDGRTVSAKILRISNIADVAVIELSKPVKDIPTAKIGDSDKLRIGEDVFVIGAPLGLAHSVSKGIVSGKHSQTMATSSNKNMEFIQTDASINKGNSGGPMFNMEGEVVGIVSSILSFSGGFEGLGFAASSNIAADILTQRGSIWFGIDAIPMSPDMCKVLNVPQTGGLLVQNVADNSQAFFMGVRGGYLKMNITDFEFLAGGDVILAFDDIKFEDENSYEKFRKYLNTVDKYHKYTITILRAGEIKKLQWQLTD